MISVRIVFSWFSTAGCWTASAGPALYYKGSSTAAEGFSA